MTDDYFMLPRFDRRKTIVCNGVAGLFAVGCLIAHVAGLDGVWLGVEASLVLLAMAGMNTVLRLLTRKPFWLEPWERDLVKARHEHLTAGEVLNFEGRLTADPYANDYVSAPDHLVELNRIHNERKQRVHEERNAENARVLAEHLDGKSREVYDDMVGANVLELPDDRVIDMANGKA